MDVMEEVNDRENWVASSEWMAEREGNEKRLCKRET